VLLPSAKFVGEVKDVEITWRAPDVKSELFNFTRKTPLPPPPVAHDHVGVSELIGEGGEDAEKLGLFGGV
jgi:sporulation protein YlmC with PRC-barrel domain